MNQPTAWWLSKSEELLREMMAARETAKRQGLTGPTFSQFMDERVAIWLQRTFGSEPPASVGPQRTPLSREEALDAMGDEVERHPLGGHGRLDPQHAPTSLAAEARASARLDGETHCLPDEGGPQKPYCACSSPGCSVCHP